MKPQDLLGTNSGLAFISCPLTSLLAIYWNTGFVYQINVRQQPTEVFTLKPYLEAVR